MSQRKPKQSDMLNHLMPCSILNIWVHLVNYYAFYLYCDSVVYILAKEHCVTAVF